VADAGALWEKHKQFMCEDFLRDARRTHPGADLDVAAVENRGLIAMHRLLEHLNQPLSYYGLPDADFTAEEAQNEHRILAQQRAYDTEVMKAVVAAKTGTSNADQLSSFNTIKAAVDDYLTEAAEAAAAGGRRRAARSRNARRAQPRCFFLNGPAGTGKTFVYDMLLAYVRGLGEIALATATCGIAALLLPGGATAHNTFKIPVEVLTAESLCRSADQVQRGRLHGHGGGRQGGLRPQPRAAGRHAGQDQHGWRERERGDADHGHQAHARGGRGSGCGDGGGGGGGQIGGGGVARAQQRRRLAGTPSNDEMHRTTKCNTTIYRQYRSPPNQA
jgi:hypothetical protein